MVGQTKLLEKLNSYSLETLPHSILLLGEKGAGKHTIANLLASNFGLDIIDMTSNVEENFINNIYISTNVVFYLIDLSNITEKEQNKLLKLVEEPPLHSFLILIGIDKSLILKTILNRCFILELEPYTQEQLQQFTNHPVDLELFKTPGQIKNFNFNTLSKTQEVIEKLINININYPSFLSLSDIINYKDEYDKIDLDILINLMLEKLKENYLKKNLIIYLNYYKITLELKKKLINSRLNKKHLVENYLTQLWKESKNDSKRIKN